MISTCGCGLRGVECALAVIGTGGPVQRSNEDPYTEVVRLLLLLFGGWLDTLLGGAAGGDLAGGPRPRRPAHRRLAGA
eukprot:9277654-Pyramimonas_sp.AAC.3